ncbi:MAG: 50S ribosomal protein L4 [Alphaproteobacteria bacterium]|nr:50S ribosomal protein L4 [Alphaproteobacteria bacterium]OJV45044.1 MAG: 50S ribosomal protein L4 [Alphaproteobacteria bacterium 43-37]
MEVNVINVSGKNAGKVTLSDDVFGLSVRPDIIARTIRWQLAKRRQGSHATKGISDISGTTRKPYKQKGTGRARQGSLRSPQFRGGATIFGPVVRSHEHDLPKKVRKLALKIALSDKLRNNQLLVCDFSDFTSGKAKDMNAILSAIKADFKSVLIIDGLAISKALSRSVSNVQYVDCLPQIGSNVYDIVRRDTLILTPDAVKLLEERLK